MEDPVKKIEQTASNLRAKATQMTEEARVLLNLARDNEVLAQSYDEMARTYTTSSTPSEVEQPR